MQVILCTCQSTVPYTKLIKPFRHCIYLSTVAMNKTLSRTTLTKIYRFNMLGKVYFYPSYCTQEKEAVSHEKSRRATAPPTAVDHDEVASTTSGSVYPQEDSSNSKHGGDVGPFEKCMTWQRRFRGCCLSVKRVYFQVHAFNIVDSIFYL